MQLATRSALEVAMPVPDDKAAVIETLREYYAASNKHDGPATVSYYSEPVMFITAEGVAARATHAEVLPGLQQFFEHLRTMGVARSEWAEAHCKQLSATLVVAGIVVVRYGADGGELERVGWTYLVQKTSAGWKLAVLASHSPDTVLRVA
jgi:ketosteroid isomerase-like protein